MNVCGVYKKPLYYGLIHILCGFIAFHYSYVGVIFLLYQIFQLVLNKRFFIFQQRIEEGNSVIHTSVKISEFILGIFIAFIFSKCTNI